jgi:xylan 1,4-beta-xylosidase
MYKNKIYRTPAVLLVILIRFTALSQQATINIDLKKELGEMKPIWAWFGYDEPTIPI